MLEHFHYTTKTTSLTRRTVLGSATASLSVALTAACGTGTSRDTGTAATTSLAPQKVIVWVPGVGNPSYPPAYEDFLKRNPGWTGELVENVPYAKFQTSVAGGDVPDAYFAQFDTIQVAAHKG